MNAQIDLIGILILVALAAIPILLWRFSSTSRSWLKLPVRVFAALFAMLVVWIAVVNTLFLLRAGH